MWSRSASSAHSNIQAEPTWSEGCRWMAQAFTTGQSASFPPTSFIYGGTRSSIATKQFGLTSDQRAQIAFARPAGLPAANYQAKLLATGEMVPDTKGSTLGFSQANNVLSLSWNNNSFELLSSTNVAGPYQPI